MSDRQLIADLLSALEYHTEQTRPIEFSRVAIEVAREYLRKPAQQQEPATWMQDCADFWEHYTYISEASQENYKAQAQMWVEKLRTSPQPSKPWVGLTDEEKAEIKKQANYNWETTAGEYASKVQALTEAKLREKNA